MSGEVSNRIAYPLIFLAFGLAAIGIINKNNISDWLYFRGYTPSYFHEKIVEDAGFNDRGARLYWRADPQLVDEAAISRQCGGEHNLGCLVTGPKIYILEFDKPSEDEYSQSVVYCCS